jgi:hypothetical protein
VVGKYMNRRKLDGHGFKELPKDGGSPISKRLDKMPGNMLFMKYAGQQLLSSEGQALHRILGRCVGPGWDWPRLKLLPLGGVNLPAGILA